MYTTTPDGLRAAANDCMTTNENIQGRITAMRNFMADIQAVSRGPAAVALQNLATQWDVHATNLNNVLTKISNGLNHNANNFDLTETENTRNIQHAEASLPPARL